MFCQRLTRAVRPRRSILGFRRHWLVARPMASPGDCGRHGYQLVSDPEGFILDDAYGPVRPAEMERAKQWGAQLVRASVSGSA
jgi:hypothetical protein